MLDLTKCPKAINRSARQHIIVPGIGLITALKKQDLLKTHAGITGD